MKQAAEALPLIHPPRNSPFQDSRTEMVGDPYHPHALSFCILESRADNNNKRDKYNLSGHFF